MNSARIVLVLLVASLAFLPSVLPDAGVRASPGPGRITFATVALEGNFITVPPAPPFRPMGGTYKLLDFGDPHVRESGGVAFLASTTLGPAPEPCLVLLGDGSSSPSIIAADGDDISGQPLVICEAPGAFPTSQPLINNNGDVAFQAKLGTNWALWVQQSGGPLIPVVTQGDPVPGGGGTYGKPQLLDFNDNGYVLFQADKIPTLPSDPIPILWRWDTSAITKVVAKDDGPLPEGGNVDGLGGGGGGGGAATMNNSGDVVWRATTTGGGGGSGGSIYVTAYPGTTHNKVVQATDKWEAGYGATKLEPEFNAVASPHLQDDGVVTFHATVDPPYGEGYFLAQPDGSGGYTYEKRVLEEDPDPESGGTWDSLLAQSAHYSASGEVMVSAHDGTTSEVLYLYPSYDRVVGVGDDSPDGPSYTAIQSSTMNQQNLTIGGVIGGPVGGCSGPDCDGVWVGGWVTDPDNPQSQTVPPDYDNDGIATGHETNCGIDSNADTVIDLDFDLDGDTVCDVDPDVPDVFVEQDYMDCTVTSSVVDMTDPKDLDLDGNQTEPDGIPDDDLPCDCSEDGITTCSDSIDNGPDGATDAADPDCINHATGLYDASLNLEDGVQACDDDIDNGSDGDTDGDDSDCHNHKPLGGIIEGGASGPLGVYSCEDGLDNDSDGDIDLADSDCSVVKSFADSPVHNTSDNEDGVATCSDGVDNGGDTVKDNNDPDCTPGGPYDPSLDEDKIRGTCNDGVDNTGDGKADAGIDLNGDYDYVDPNEFPPDDDCTGVNLHVVVDEAIPHAKYLDFPSEHCSNNLDDDGDTKVDANDPNCLLGGPFPCADGVGFQPDHSSFDLVKAHYFGSSGDSNATITAKKLVFHYSLSTHMVDTNNTMSGCGEEPGNDFYVSLGGWSHISDAEHEGTFMHELGHNLGLCHGGPLNPALNESQCDWNYKPNYLSVMNYTFSFPWTPDGQATGRPLDYSRVALPPGDPALAGCPAAGQGNNVLNENAKLDEQMAIDCTNASAVPATWSSTAYTYVSGNSCPFQVTSATGGIDWDKDGIPNEVNQSAPLNDPAMGGPNALPACFEEDVFLVPLKGYADWPKLKYDFRGAAPGYGDGLPNAPVPPDEPDNVLPDTDSDGWHDGQDNCPDISNGGQEDGDVDGVGDFCDNCPAWPNSDQSLPPWMVPANDPDCDGFTDAEEAFVGCDPADNCPDDPDDDAWPADLAHTTLGYGKHDGTSNILDIVWLTPPYFNTTPPDPNYSIRKDFNGDSWINILDIVRLTPPVFNESCTP